MSQNKSFFYENEENKENVNNTADMGFENEYAYRAVMEYKSRGWSVASFVLSLVSVVCCCAWYVMIVAAILGIIFAIVSRKNLGYFDGLSIAGLVLGIFGFVFTAFLAFFMLSGLAESFIVEYENFFGEYMGDINGSV